jgi:hypothetical protein
VGYAAVNAWSEQPPDELIAAHAAWPAKRRPDRRDVELVALVLAMNTRDRRGYSDLTVDQIAAKCRHVMSAARVNAVLQFLTGCGLIVTVKPAAPNRAPWRVFRCFDPAGFIERCGSEPTASVGESLRGSGVNVAGLAAQRCGADPTPLLELSKNSLAARSFDVDELIATCSERDRQNYPGPPSRGRFAGSRDMAADYRSIVDTVIAKCPTASTNVADLIDYCIATRRGESVSTSLRRAMFPRDPCAACDDTGVAHFDTNGDELPAPMPCPTCTNQPRRNTP